MTGSRDRQKQKRDGLVQSQYESYPYPERDPADEKTRLIAGSPSSLHELNHYVFGGARDLTKPLRALVAGGGTGDAAIMLAQHMQDAAAECRAHTRQARLSGNWGESRTTRLSDRCQSR
jgi:hypothetical protein